MKVWDGAAWVDTGGKILQVVSVTKSNPFDTASTTFTDLTGLSLSITPSATSSKIYLVVSTMGDNSTAGQCGFLRLMRDATAVAIGDAEGSRERATYPFSSYAGANTIYVAAANFLDSPNTTSAITYKVQVRVTGGTGYINRSFSNTNDLTHATNISTLTAMEVAG
jgi:hypothetical protein